MAGDSREHLRELARKGGVRWVQMGHIWPELDACYCQGAHPHGVPCSEIRLQQLEALFARDDAVREEGHSDG